jgi:hypothetical protein
LNLLVDFHKIEQEGRIIEGDRDTIILNRMAWTVLKYQRFKFMGWMQNIRQSALDYQGLSMVTMVTRPLLSGS